VCCDKAFRRGRPKALYGFLSRNEEFACESKDVSIRENLAANLRRLCKDHASVSAVCRELGINRTQFERYLQGQTVPNKATAKLICDYFEGARQ